MPVETSWHHLQYRQVRCGSHCHVFGLFYECALVDLLVVVNECQLCLTYTEHLYLLSTLQRPGIWFKHNGGGVAQWFSGPFWRQWEFKNCSDGMNCGVVEVIPAHISSHKEWVFENDLDLDSYIAWTVIGHFRNGMSTRLMQKPHNSTHFYKPLWLLHSQLFLCCFCLLFSPTLRLISLK